MENNQSLFDEFVRTVEMLRRHCPWDKKQTLETSRKYLNEEFQEVLEALTRGDSEELKEELGDLVFMIVLIAQICRDSGKFSIVDVIAAINSKMIRRHPHVFENNGVCDEAELRAQWQRIKAEEKKSKKIDTNPSTE